MDSAVAEVSLRGGREPKASSAKPMVSFRCPPELRDYLKEVARQPGRDQTEVIASALELDRDLGRLLKGDSARLEAFAADHGLRLGPDLPEVLARLVRRGLDAYGKDGKGRAKR